MARSYLGLVAAMLTAGSAHAMARPPQPVTQVGELRLTEGILVTRADLVLTCTLGADDTPTCALHASYVLSNAGPARVDGAGALPVTESARDVTLTLDGSATATPKEELPLGVAKGYPPPKPRPFALSIEAGSSKTLALDAVLFGSRTTGHLGLTPSPVHARHVLLHTPSLRRTMELILEAPPEALRAPNFKGSVRLRAPEGWDLGAANEWTREPDGTRTLDGAGIQTTLRVPQFPLRNGGVLLGLGGAYGDTGGFRMRLGWEVAAPSWLLHQVSAETDLRGRWTVTPLVLAASNPILLIPSFGLGVGLPIAVRPETRVGVRLQLEAQILPVGFVASCDFWPRTSSAPGTTQWTLLGQIAF